PAAPLWSSLSFGATYGGAIRSGALWHGPGVIVALDEPRWLADPELWVEGRWVLPQTWNQPGDVVQTISMRAGVSARLSTYLRLGVGGGADREAEEITTVPMVDPRVPTMTTRIPANWRPAGRLFGRVVSRSWRGFAASATLYAEAVHAADPQNTFRAGITVEGWWRSSGD
ncbi:MAG TPA: hypothetical protein VHL80_04855, partial [Polyangia bacterium]|nr:hypothetical protein [Polyangia bacterium]